MSSVQDTDRPAISRIGGTHQPRSEPRDGMHIDWDVQIEMDDGLILRADVFRPRKLGRYPVLLSYGPYAKGLAFQEGYPSAWQRMIEQHPDVARGSSNKYQNWEVVDPEKWVPHDYACVRVDSRGCGCSPGYIDNFSPRETNDFYNCIEWAGVQPWSNGRVGLNGISYYGINQWHVASLQPPHLAAMCIWEGAADWYRDMTHHGGILSTFWANWYDMQVKTVQYGVGERGKRSPVHGELVCGPRLFSENQLAQNRCNFGEEIQAHPLDDDYHKARSPVWSKVKVPFLSAANWGGQGLHPRGNFEGFVRAASKEKWLEAHGIEHWTHFYTDYGRNLQKRFFDHFLHDKKNGWDRQPKVLLQVRHIDRFEERAEQEWPLKRTKWTKFYLTPDGGLSERRATQAITRSFAAMGEGLTFLSAPLETETEITGPSALKLVVSSSTRDADIFAVLRVFSPDMREVVFQGAIDPHTPVAQGWLRASHRKLDLALSKPYRPFHTHDEPQPLRPGLLVELDIEIWPSSIVIPTGYRLGVTIRGKDYEYGAASGGKLSNFKNELKGCGPFLHDDPMDRPAKLFSGTTTLHFESGREPFILLPVIPPPQRKAVPARQSRIKTTRKKNVKEMRRT
ncbi:MAG: CocE/NonD family hydrolase [Pseudorhodoplanes sp.]|nr:CocE/NonD family hydrolase [Pseudorhodoplanes sp.]